MATDPRYPEIEVQLVGRDGNAFSILGKVQQAMLRNDVPAREFDVFLKEAMAGDYDHLLQTCMRWVTVN